MANVAFKTGLQANLPTPGNIEEGCLYFCTDTGNIYHGASSNSLVLLSRNDFYGTCDSAASSQVKVVTLQDADGFSLRVGMVIRVKFAYTNTYNAVKLAPVQLNVNGTGAKVIVSFSSVVAEGEQPAYYGRVNYVNSYVYNGSQWVWQGSSVDNNSSYTPVKLGFGYGTCDTAAETTAKVVSLFGYVLNTNGFVAVKFTYEVPASATMNINNKGAKAIYYRGAPITDNIIQAGDTGLFVYSPPYYHLITTDRVNNEIIDVDDNCLIIDVCKRLDLSAVGNKIEITLPSGYVCTPTNDGSDGVLKIDTYGSNSTPWSTTADITYKYIEANTSVETINSRQEISNNISNSLGLRPFIKTYIKVEVDTAAVGTNTFAVIRGRIYCHKE